MTRRGPTAQRKRREGGGRHQINDENHLVDIARLVETEKMSPWQAAQKVAPGAEGHSLPSTAARLHKKYLANPAIYRQKFQAQGEDLFALIVNDQATGIKEAIAQTHANLANISVTLQSTLSDLHSIFYPRRSRK